MAADDAQGRSAWRNFEEVARFLLNQMSASFGLDRVEGKQPLKGQRSGTTWEIDAKGVREATGGIVLVECRRRSRATAQEEMAGLAYRILDTGADGGILVSPLSPQEGAQLVAEHEHIVHVRLSPESTTQEFVLQFLNQTFIGIAPEVLSISDHVSAVLIDTSPDESSS